MNKPIIIGISGSPRSRFDKHNIKKIIDGIHDEQDLNNVIEKTGRDQSLSNSDICLLAALYGAKKYSVDIEIESLNKIFDNNGIKDQEKLANLIKKAQGIIFASPVYFGDQSVLVNSMLNFAKEKDLLKKKVVGCVSVGAKRNGGQETTNIYLLKELNDYGAYVVGNGPPTSQYGGTAWAGDIGSIREDSFGINTSIGVGRKVSEIVSTLNMVKEKNVKEKLHVGFWIVKDVDDKMDREVDKLISSVNKKNIFDLSHEKINFTKMNFTPCRACRVCPYFKDKKDIYKCMIKKDDFVNNYEKIIKVDAVIICGYQTNELKEVEDVYQKTLERTRCIRRDNFLLSNIPITSLSIYELPSKNDSLFSLKVMTSFLRHNTVISPPLKTYIYNEERLDYSEKDIINFFDFSIRIKKGKKLSSHDETPIYIPVGYSTK